MGNIAQVVGYKVGMLTGGGLFIAASATVPWHTLLLGMAGLVLLALCAVAALPAARVAPRVRVRVAAIVADLVRALVGSGPLLVFLITYKLGESIASGVWKVFLFDAGMGKPFIGTLSVVGMWASIGGSLAGGMLASRLPILTALWIPAIARLVPLVAQVAVALHPSAAAALVVSVAEHLAGGALTTVVFTLMMSRVDRRIGASHYTALAAVEVAGKYPGYWMAGLLGDALGYPAVFTVAVIATALVLLAIPPLRRGAPAMS